MSIIAAGTTTTTALSSTGNTDGTLQFQVNGTTPSVTLNTLGAVGVGSSPNYGTSGQVLISGGSTTAPTWGTAGTATNLAGGSAGVVPYQTGSGATSFTAVGSSGQFLTSNGSSAPTWTTLTTSSVTQSTINTSTAAVAGTYYLITASLTLTLPASPTAGQFVAFSNISGTTTPVIARNGLNIMALAENMTLNSTQARGTLVYTDATNGWVLFND